MLNPGEKEKTKVFFWINKNVSEKVFKKTRQQIEISRKLKRVHGLFESPNLTTTNTATSEDDSAAIRENDAAVGVSTRRRAIASRTTLMDSVITDAAVDSIDILNAAVDSTTTTTCIASTLHTGIIDGIR